MKGAGQADNFIVTIFSDKKFDCAGMRHHLLGQDVKGDCLLLPYTYFYVFRLLFPFHNNMK